jgi:hypothetical protein
VAVNDFLEDSLMLIVAKYSSLRVQRFLLDVAIQKASWIATPHKEHAARNDGSYEAWLNLPLIDNYFDAKI